MHIGSVLLLVWLVIGGIAAGQRGDFNGPMGCSSAGTIAVTLLAGPLADQDDERLRGIVVLAVDPPTARRLYADDPAVRAGRLEIQAMTWMVPAGNVTWNPVTHPRSMAEADG